MDGSLTSRVERAKDRVIGPAVSLFFDTHSERLFWSDLGSGKIMSVGKEGDYDLYEVVVTVGKKGWLVKSHDLKYFARGSQILGILFFTN